MGAIVLVVMVLWPMLWPVLLAVVVGAIVLAFVAGVCDPPHRGPRLRCGDDIALARQRAEERRAAYASRRPIRVASFYQSHG